MSHEVFESLVIVSRKYILGYVSLGESESGSQNGFCVSLPEFPNGFWIRWIHSEEGFKGSNPDSTKSTWSGSWIQFWILPKKHTLRLICLYSSYSHELGKRKQQLTIERNWKTNLFCINAHTHEQPWIGEFATHNPTGMCCSQAFSFLHTWRPGLKYFSQTVFRILRDSSKMVLHLFQRCTFNAP